MDEIDAALDILPDAECAIEDEVFDASMMTTNATSTLTFRGACEEDEEYGETAGAGERVGGGGGNREDSTGGGGSGQSTETNVAKLVGSGGGGDGGGEGRESANAEKPLDASPGEPTVNLLQQEKTPRFSLSLVYGDFFSEYQGKAELPNDVLDFVRVPWYIETFLLFGQTFCFDAFLWALTLFPFRAIVGGVLIFASALESFLHSFAPVTIRMMRSSPRLSQIRNPFPPPSPSQCFDAICLLAVIGSAFIYVESGAYALTNWLGAKSALRLSAIFAACTVIDSLCGKYNLDLCDAIYYQLRSLNGHKQPYIFLIILLTGTIFIHSLTLTVTISTIRVASRRSDALFALLFRDQMAEIKRDALKKFTNTGLFDLTCDDVLERFQEHFFLLLVFFVTLDEAHWEFSWPLVTNLLYIYSYLVGSEMLVDWVKHSFITEQSPDNQSQQYIGFAQHIIKQITIRDDGTQNLENVYRKMKLGIRPLIYLATLINLLLYLSDMTDLGKRAYHYAVFLVLWVILVIFKYAFKFCVINPFIRYYQRQEEIVLDFSNTEKLKKG